MELLDRGRPGLLERTRELEELSQLVEAAGAGAGRMVVLEGPAGIGKTSLLSACGRAAAESGMVVMEARGDRLVMESSFAAVRELLWRQVELAGVDALEGAARHAAPVFESAPTVVVDPDQTARVLHGLYWLVASLAEGAAVALLVDDAQWLDAASERFLVYLGRRLESLPVLVAVALRQGEALGLAAVLSEQATAVLHGRDGNVWFSEGADPGRVAFVASPPTVATVAANGVGAFFATLNASVNPHHTAVSSCRFDYGTTGAYGNSFPCEQTVGDGVSPVGVSADLGPGTMSGPLTPATTYHFRVVATNLGGTSYGADETFSTPLAAPVISAAHAVSVTQNSANLAGAVNPEGSRVTSCRFAYGTTNAYGNAAPCAESAGAGTTPVAVSATVSALAPGTTYHFQLVATNAIATGHSLDHTFTTLARTASGAPRVTTGHATMIERTTARLTGSVNPRGTPTAYHFEYGRSKAYGARVPARNAAAGSNRRIHSLSAAIRGLAPGTTYHFRLLATNRFGITRGADMSFTTLPPNRNVPTANARPFAILGASVAGLCRQFDCRTKVRELGALSG